MLADANRRECRESCLFSSSCPPPIPWSTVHESKPAAVEDDPSPGGKHGCALPIPDTCGAAQQCCVAGADGGASRAGSEPGTTVRRRGSWCDVLVDRGTTHHEG